MKEKVQITRKQHYVWRAYLKSWVSSEGIFCYRAGKIWKTKDLMSIGCEKDFYKLVEITEKESDFIRALVTEKKEAPLLTKITNDWIRTYKLAYFLPKILRWFKIISEEKYKKMVIEAEEKVNCKIEEMGNSYLQKLKSADISFYKNTSDKIIFNQYICEQFFRTKKRFNSLAKIPDRGTGIDFQKIWPPLRHIYANRLAWTLSLPDRNFHLVLFLNQAENNFITGDQPVINRFATKEYQNGLKPIHDFEFYYPITPKIAILLTERTYDSEKLMVNSVDLVNELNELIFVNSEEQIYGYTEDDVKKFKNSDIMTKENEP